MKYQEWVWTDEFVTGQDTVDYQHRTLFNTINDLVRACNESSQPNGLLVEVALDELIKYAGHHFADEEEIMKAHNFAGFEDHHAQHVAFAARVIDFKKQFSNGKDIADELLTFMQKWLVDHILQRDKAVMKMIL